VIKAANLFPNQTKDVAWHVMESFDESMHLALYGDPNAVHAVQQREHPP
jgi:hypothetical protein